MNDIAVVQASFRCFDLTYSVLAKCEHCPTVVRFAGEVPMPTLAAYGASKAALAVFSRAMRLELLQWGVEVVLIQPSGFRTSRFSEKIHLSDFSKLNGRLVRTGYRQF